MRKFGFVIIIALLTLSALSERGDRAGSTDGEASGAGEPANLQQPTHHRLEVLTYNAFLRPAPVGWGDEVACRAERIGQRLLDEFSERDVIAFNETFHESSVDDLAETLEEAFPHQLLRRPKSGGGRINGGLSLLSRHPIEQWDSQSFSRCEGDFSNCLANKGFLWTLLRVSTHLKVNVVTTHLNSGGGDEAREVRRRQLGELRDYLDKLPTTDDWPTILTGDLNINGLRVDTDSDRTSSSNEYTDAMARLGNTCARCESARCFATCDAYPVDTFRDHHGPWSHDAQNTVEPNTYNCTG
ncbi:MAG: endonuclease/exonuclease/phosphatase family protein, partial [Persicimonas sp.]